MKHRLFPVQTEPLKVRKEGFGKFRATTLGVNVFNPQQETLPRPHGKKRRKGMSDMEIAGGAGSKAGDFNHETFYQIFR